jgi:hypothetical protein
MKRLDYLRTDPKHSFTYLAESQPNLLIWLKCCRPDNKASRHNHVKNCIALFGPSSCKTSGVSLSLSLTCHHVYIFVVLVCCNARYGTLLSSMDHWNIVLNLKASPMAQYEQYSAVCHWRWVWVYREESLKIQQRVRNSPSWFRSFRGWHNHNRLTDWLTDWLPSCTQGEARWCLYVPSAVTFRKCAVCPHGVGMSVVCLVSLNSVNRLGLVMKMQYVYWEVDI